MKINKSHLKETFLRWSVLILVLIISCAVILYKVRPLIVTYAKSQAETILLNAANEAIVNVIEKENITYDGISRISRNQEGRFTGVEIDTKQVNLFKSKISNEISNIMSDKTYFNISIPLGTLLGGTYTVGLGPKITFHMQQTHTSKIDFKSNFCDAGINQVLHQIITEINISANIILLGYSDSFSVSTTAIAAQTVIVGVVPDSYTNVIEEPGDDIADEIFNYSDLR